MSYTETVTNMSDDHYMKILSEAQAYNQRLSEKGFNWNMTDEEKSQYARQLNMDDSGNMGYIKIPKLGVELSLFHGTDDSVLLTSVGHLEETSLPVGGKATHSVLSAHRGLPSAKLFTDLDQLREGDIFTLHVLNETYTYKVDKIWVVEPTDLTNLTIEEDKDYCTLVTCTPYAINTHRLLVRGYRIPNTDGESQLLADAIQIKPLLIAPFLALPILMALFIYIWIVTSKRFGRKTADIAHLLEQMRS